MINLLNDTLITLAALILTPLAAIAVVGGAIAILQAAMQLQEASLSQLGRIVAICTVIFLLGQAGYGLLEDLVVQSIRLAGRL